MNTEPNDPINPCLYQKIGDNEYRPNKPGDDRMWNVPMGGLTKREYFASISMQGVIVGSTNSCEIDAEIAVKQADALIQELNKSEKPKSFQQRVMVWMGKAFQSEISKTPNERNHRFLEEALELVQSNGCSKEEALKLVDYVYGRQVGEFKQEVGGVMVTLAALCGVCGTDMQNDGEVELQRINTPEIIEKIRKKQLSKPHASPLPGKIMDNENII